VLETPCGLEPCFRDEWINIGEPYAWRPYTTAAADGLTVWHYTDMMSWVEPWNRCGTRRSAGEDLSTLEMGIVHLEERLIGVPLLGAAIAPYSHRTAPMLPFVDVTTSVVMSSVRAMQQTNVEPLAEELVLYVERLTGDIIAYLIRFMLIP
jgi:hypothetical protein